MAECICVHLRGFTFVHAESARLANVNPPKLVSHARTGARVDEVEFHPAYHDMFRLGYAAGQVISA